MHLVSGIHLTCILAGPSREPNRIIVEGEVLSLIVAEVSFEFHLLSLTMVVILSDDTLAVLGNVVRSKSLMPFVEDKRRNLDV